MAGVRHERSWKRTDAHNAANNIRRTLTKQMACPIILKWKDNPKDISQVEKVVEEKNDCMLEPEESGG